MTSPTPRPFYRRPWVIAVGVVLVLAGIGAATSNKSKPTAAAAPSVSSSPAPVVSSSSAAATTSPVPSSTTTAAGSSGSLSLTRSTTCGQWNAWPEAARVLSAHTMSAAAGAFDTSQAFAEKFERAIESACKGGEQVGVESVVAALATVDRRDFS